MRESLAPNIHQQCGLGVEYILKNSLVRRTLDNVTCVIVGFYNLKRKMIVQAEHNCKVAKDKAPEEAELEDEAHGGGAGAGLHDGEAEETKPQHLVESPLAGKGPPVPATTSHAALRRKHFDFSDAALERFTHKPLDN